MRAWHSRHLVAFLSAAVAVTGVAAGMAAAPAAATVAAARRPAGPAAAQRGTLPGAERRVCPAVPGQAACQAVYQLAGDGPAAPAFAPAGDPVTGYGPASLRSAYGLAVAARRQGRGETVAVVDAYSDPRAAADLAAYRHHFGLGPCTAASGCLRIVNQAGHAGPLPRPNTGWAVEESLDLDMVSAICPRCRLLLVEASHPTNASLGRAEAAAVTAGARFVSNSWSGSVSRRQWIYNHYFNHPGVAVVFASGDSGYGPVYPADLPFVTSVGGTTLRFRPSGTRAWTETVWGSTIPAVTGGTGSGCSPYTAKPSWQDQPVDTGPGGCPTRTQNDVSAVADPATGVAVYDSYQTHGTWAQIGGTSAAAPIITGVYALAGYPAPRSYPASYLYQHAAFFHDVTAGVNGRCPAASAYLCHGEPGYDGPSGLGTPAGTRGFSRLGTSPVTLVDPGSKTVAAGAAWRLPITGLDTRSATRPLAWSADGLPPGLSVAAVPGSTNGVISGTVPGTVPPGTVYEAVVTGAAAGASGVTQFTITVR